MLLLHCPNQKRRTDTRTLGHPDKLLVRISVNNSKESKNRLIPTFAIEDEERDPVHMHHGMTLNSSPKKEPPNRSPKQEHFREAYGL